jgi:hypothetical protein
MSGVGGAELLVILVVLAVFWAYPAICFQRIAVKSGTEPAWLAWVPVASAYLLCKLGRTPGWWLLLFLIPYVGVIFVFIVLSRIPKCLGITDSSRFLAIVPVVNYVYFGYLAFRQEPVPVSPAPRASA